MIAAVLRGLSPYATVHDLQRRLVDQRSRGEGQDVLLLLEHAPTITVGRGRDAALGLLDPGATPVVEVERGGQATWHGPGQLVAYPIVALHPPQRDLHAHMRALEQAVIDVLAELGLPSQRDSRNTGVWLPSPPGLPRKVCSVGIACRRWVTWHGLALNVHSDPTSFDSISPCGFPSTVMTRLADHKTPAPALEALRDPLADALAHRLGRPLTETMWIDDAEAAFR